MPVNSTKQQAVVNMIKTTEKKYFEAESNAKRNEIRLELEEDIAKILRNYSFCIRSVRCLDGYVVAVAWAERQESILEIAHLLNN